VARPLVRLAAALGVALLALALGSRALHASSLAAAEPEAGILSETGESFPICFWSAQGPICVDRPVQAGPAARPPDPEALIAALLAGPTAGERAEGLSSAIPHGTVLDSVQVWPDRTVVVRFYVPTDALFDLSPVTFEAIVEQVGSTLEPVGWRDLRIQAWNQAVGEFVSLASFLPEIPAPRKEAVLMGEEGMALAPAYVGQPPAPGQGQPQGALSGKTVYVSAGHGWYWPPDSGYTTVQWRTQRPPYPNPPYVGSIIEDHNNAEAVNQYLLHYLWNAGASIWPVREQDMNGAEVVVDNDQPAPDAGYSETGLWTTTAFTGTGYAGTDYRYATTVTGTPTAAAVWTATLPVDGRYAVYVWYRPGSGRAPDAGYTVHHAGGETAVSVDQRHHGQTWHYLGTYGFRAGEVATITLTNLSAHAGRVVIADAVRFGGGTFDDLTGIGTGATGPPHEPWWEVASFYYVQKMGMPEPPYGDVTARPIYARWEHAGTGDDAVYVSYHSNGFSGYQEIASGTETYVHNGEGLTRTQGSLALRHVIHTEVVNDIRAGWDPAWNDRGEKLKNLGELRELWDDDPAVRMPGALIEVAFHDHPSDTDALKEPSFQMLSARAIYQGILKYFEQRDGVDLAELPEPPTHLRVQNLGGGRVRVAWRPPPTDTLGLVGDAATGYRVYTSSDGLGWSNGLPVPTTAFTLTGLSGGQLLFVRVTATNDGGESFPTETLGVRVGESPGVLLVNGFDRLNGTMLVPETDPTEGYNLRLFLDRMNRYDYSVQHGGVISYAFDSASNEAVQDGLVSLSDYTLVDWILGEESTSDETLNAAERALLADFLSGGGALFVSGAEVGYHLDSVGADEAFYNSVLRADYAGDDAETYRVAPAAGSIFEGLAPFDFDAPGMYDADYPDQLTPLNGSVAALTYDGGLGGTAAVQYAAGCQHLVYFGFPFETIRPDHRSGVMGRVLGFLDACLEVPVQTYIASPVDGSAHRTLPTFSGTAGAGEMAALARVEVQIQRTSDGRYLGIGGGGVGTIWLPGSTWLTATGTSSWSYPLPPLEDDGYYLRARAWTVEGDVDLSPAEVLFTYDTVPPAPTVLITPTGAVTISAPSVVTLAWQAVPPDGGSPLAYVVALDAKLYTTTLTTYRAPGIAGGEHTWGVQVFDGAGNRSAWITDTFSVNQYVLWLPVVMRNPDQGVQCENLLINGGFESDQAWVLNNLAVYDTTEKHSGVRSARVGIPPGEPGNASYSSVAQTLVLPASTLLPPGATGALRLWSYSINEGDDADDWHYVSLRDQSGGYYAVDGQFRSDARQWVLRRYDLGEYVVSHAGESVTLYLGTRNDGDDDTAALYVDDVMLEVCTPR
jgi:hypothetical protein